MQRLLLKELKSWQNRASRLPLLLRGSRQTGKTTLVEQFSKYFNSFININFELEPDYKDCFVDLEPKKILELISVINKQNIVPGETLLFLDEIQECPKAIQALRYFKEKIPKLHVIGAGSLLEFALQQAEFRMPVGRVEFLYLYPMNFVEFMQACGEDKLLSVLGEASLNNPPVELVHKRCLELLRRYYITGGMPAIVKNFIVGESLLRLQSLQLQLLATFRNDFGKYASTAYQNHCQTIFNKMPELLSKHFKYVDVDPGIDSRTLKVALNLLRQAGLIYPVHATALTGLPLNSNINMKKFKLLFLDIGLIKAAGKIEVETLLKQNLFDIRQGALAEQFVGQELISHQLPFDSAELFYWQQDKRGSQAEVDYVLNYQEQIIPTEVKAGTTGRLKSLHMCMRKYNLPTGVKISMEPLSIKSNIINIPFYMLHKVRNFLDEVIT